MHTRRGPRCSSLGSSGDGGGYRLTVTPRGGVKQEKGKRTVLEGDGEQTVELNTGTRAPGRRQRPLQHPARPGGESHSSSLSCHPGVLARGDLPGSQLGATSCAAELASFCPSGRAACAQLPACCSGGRRRSASPPTPSSRGPRAHPAGLGPTRCCVKFRGCEQPLAARPPGSERPEEPALRCLGGGGGAVIYCTAVPASSLPRPGGHRRTAGPPPPAPTQPQPQTPAGVP